MSPRGRMPVPQQRRIFVRGVAAGLAGWVAPLSGLAQGVAGASVAGSAGGATARIETWPRGRELPAAVFTDLQGRAQSLASLRGRALVVNFWATWCEPCRTEMPTLQQVADLNDPARLLVLAVNVKDPPRTIQRFLDGAGLTLPVMTDPAGDLARLWQVRIFPTTVLVDAQGRARARVTGEVDWTSPQAQGWLTSLDGSNRR